MSLKCRVCARHLYGDESIEDHVDVCGGIDDDSIEAINKRFGSMEDMFVYACPKCNQELSQEDDLHMTNKGELVCQECLFQI